MIDIDQHQPASPQLPPPRPPTPPSPERRRRRPRWTAVVGVLAVLAGLVALIGLYLDAAGERDDNADALAQKRSELATVESEVDDLEGTVDDLEGEVQQLGASLAGREDELESLTAALESARDDLETAGSERDGAQAKLDEVSDSVVGVVAGALETGAGFSSGDSSCIAEALIVDRGVEFIGTIFDLGVGQASDAEASSMASALYAAAAACDADVPDDEFVDSPGFPEALPGKAYGENPTLDALQDACVAGDGLACDDLWAQSLYGSEYQRIGLTCGDRFLGDAIPSYCEGSI